MKSFLRAALFGVTALGGASAHAILLNDFQDVGEKLSKGESYEVVHSFWPTIPNEYQAYWGLLTLVFADDSDYSKDEYAKIELAGDWWLEEIASFDIELLGISGSALIDLNEDGKLGVTVTSVKGDFWWKWSDLAVKAREVDAKVPEPGTLSLIGAGLVFLGLMRWRR